MAVSQPAKYKYLSSLDEDIIKAYHKYETEMLNILNDMTDIYYILEIEKQLYRFSIFLYNKGMFLNKNSFASGAKHVLFKSKQKLNHNAFIKYKEVRNIYNNEFEKG